MDGFDSSQKANHNYGLILNFKQIDISPEQIKKRICKKQIKMV
jgi:hypothetical protein